MQDFVLNCTTLTQREFAIYTRQSELITLNQKEPLIHRPKINLQTVAQYDCCRGQVFTLCLLEEKFRDAEVTVHQTICFYH